MSRTQKELLLIGYHQGVSSVCALTAKDVALKELREKYNSDASKPETWPPLSEVDAITDDTYENCIILNGLSSTNNTAEKLEKVVRTLDYAYAEKNMTFCYSI